MFLNALTHDQRKSFLALAAKMALADGHVSPQEVPLLQELGDAFGHDLEFPLEEVEGPPNTAPFDTRASRVLALLGVFVVAYVDEHLHVDESKILGEIVYAFGFSEQELIEMKAWAKQEAQQFNALNAIIKGKA